MIRVFKSSNMYKNKIIEKDEMIYEFGCRHVLFVSERCSSVCCLTILFVFVTGAVLPICPEGFCTLGNNTACTIPSDTVCNKCNFNGKCYKDRPTEIADVTGSYFCSCYKNRYGQKCEQMENTNDCLNEYACEHGVCISDNCKCDTGWSGQTCEMEERVVNTFDKICCKNSGTLYKQGDSYGCLCQCGFYGEFCEKFRLEVLLLDDGFSLCASLMCQNRGQCVQWPSNTDITCSCYTGYYGQFCEHTDSITTNTNSNISSATNETCQYQLNWRKTCSKWDSLACQNGGSCTMHHNEPTCTCITGFDGTYCELNNSQPRYVECPEDPTFNHPKSSAMYIALITSVPLAVLTIIAALVAIIYKHVRKPRCSRRHQHSRNNVFTIGSPPSYCDVTETTFQNAPPSYTEACEKPPPYSENTNDNNTN